MNKRELLSKLPGPHINIVLFGDSLVHETFESYQFGEKLDGHLPSYAIDWYDRGNNGNTIEDMKNRVEDVLLLHPKIVVLFWDSDCSKYSDAERSDTENQSVHEKYKADLRYVITRLLEGGIGHVVVGTPCFLGEGPLMPLIMPGRFQGKDKMLDQYAAFNEEISTSFPKEKVTYVNVRKELIGLLNREVLGYGYKLDYKGGFTTDGEHFNLRGSHCVANEFAPAIKQALDVYLKQ